MRKFVVISLVLGAVVVFSLIALLETGRIGPVVFDLERAGMQLRGDPEYFQEPEWSLNNRVIVLPYNGYLVGRRGSDYLILDLEKKKAENAVRFRYWIFNDASPASPEDEGSGSLLIRMGDLNNLTSIRLPRSFEFKFYLPNMLSLQSGVEYVYLEEFNPSDWFDSVAHEDWRRID